MSGMRRMAGLVAAASLGLVLICGSNGFAQAPAATQDAAGGSKQPYTMPEYNAYQACAAEKNPAALVKCLDDFVARYPNSNLLNYIYPLYTQAYSAQKNYAKVIESADKLSALGDKVDAGTRFSGYYTHCAAYSAIITDPANAKTAAVDAALAKSAQTACVTALKTLDEVKKPDNISDDAWATQKKQTQTFLNGVAGQAALVQKDYPSAINFFKAVLAAKPDDTISSYNLGKAYLALTPPQTMDGYWAIARAVTAKGANEKQAQSVKTYLRKLIFNYQQATCDSLTDAELNELLQLASSSADRPASYSIPSSADLDAAHKDMTILSVITDLKAGGDKAKVTWLAACGLEFPDVPGRLLEIVPGTDAVILKTSFVTNQAEFDAATTPNMEFKVVGQQGADKLEKDSAPRITGTLMSYEPDPAFMLHWDKAKVNEEDLPKEKAKPVKKPAPKRPAAKKPA
jgi:tetratricopeptide (TPR) repeat protein